MIINTLKQPRSWVTILAIFGLCTSPALADAPVFSSSSYSFNVSLDDLPGYIGAVHATDPDYDSFIYVMHDPSGLFQVMLSGGITADTSNLAPGTYDVVVEAVDEFDESSFADVEIVVVAEPAPVIVSHSVHNMGGGFWYIVGTVDSSTPEGVVNFGGLLAGKSTFYDSYGNFRLMTSVYGSGPFSMQAVDSDGQKSNVVTAVIP